MADVHGSPADPGLQMPQLAGPGPAAVPYPGGRDQAAGNPPVYAVDLGPVVDHPLDIVHPSYPTLNTTQDPSAYDVNGNPGPSPLATPYYPGMMSPILAHGDNDAGGRSPVAATVADAVANSQARWLELQSDTYTPGPVAGTVVLNEPNLSGPGHPQQQSSVIGDLMQFPPSPLDPGAGVGNTLPAAGFYDPPRGYGGPDAAPFTGNEPPRGYQGEAQ